ncbi:2-oxoglutarate dehydrogenase E1 component [Paenibacillus psychroresistens]|uniref:2-oxoglutarate dehydrogenase E1 component n=1 Tax=Paenibacillus psychroresistens TaxID=1778678 RepID=A0A6B8REV7_9BACL|nr:2-oxoglutarate dehydrogenase E1 component [Paenibacillus psychroresistens]QGQ94710.1 2-oxoglutarate dehydrogenase E1 component [Paenibacillus psychroresistens]
MVNEDLKANPWAAYLGPNLGYVQEQYEQYLINPESVEPAFRKLFEQAGEPPTESEPKPIPAETVNSSVDFNMLKNVVAANKLIWNIRTYGHLAANTDPLGLRNKSDTRNLNPETYKLNEANLSVIPASLIWENAPKEITTGWEAIQKLLQIYTSAFSYEFSHVHDEEEREWLNQRVESPQLSAPLSTEARIELLKRLLQVEQFEHFLHRTYVGQKRFSIEGVDMLVPILDEMVNRLIHGGARDVLMGMAHRGRLNVLTHVFGKPYSAIFAEFHHSPDKELIPSEGSVGINHGWTGDVKYHLGAYRVVQEGETVQAKLTLANNPSHLEFVNPVVEGFTRAAQEDRSKPGFPIQDLAKAVAVLIHGDAAFPGEGVVSETLNYNNLAGYRSGGTLHIITNNRLGFTTDSIDARSTHYASDLAKGFEIPIVHINADDPEACIAAVQLATEYRLRFHKDFLIDLVGYRRYGHNESDDPDTTQPLMYSKIHAHPTVSALYAKKLTSEGIIKKGQADEMKQAVLQEMEGAYEQVKVLNSQDNDSSPGKGGGFNKETVTQTAVPLGQLKEINNHLLDVPQGFHIYPKLQKILERRANALEEDGKVDWALAETLAFASILADGIPIRMTGQDSERGTFAHRNLVLHDPATGEKFCPLHAIPRSSASFAIYNSPLSEAAVLGFEYGYNVFSPNTLVIWEAQYGDFVNCAQVIIDQFIAAGQAKWAQKSSLVLLLPHGYEGQGPEHSSARLERFLQSSAEGNWTVANLTSSAQYFHLLRLQAALTGSEQARPLILMAPKSLIRNQQVASPGAALTEGTFEPILEQKGLGGQVELVERLVLCTGKIAIDLEAAVTLKDTYSWLHVVRVERLYPLPEIELQQIIERYHNLKELVWLQEEPQNMGAWTYIEPRMRMLATNGITVHYIGRPGRASTASGYQNIHKYEQAQMIETALKPTKKQPNKTQK